MNLTGRILNAMLADGATFSDLCHISIHQRWGATFGQIDDALVAMKAQGVVRFDKHHRCWRVVSKGRKAA